MGRVGKRLGQIAKIEPFDAGTQKKLGSNAGRAIQTDGFDVGETGGAKKATGAARPKKHKVERAGLAAADLAADQPLNPKDKRAYNDINTISSKGNVVTPLFPDLLVDPEGPDSYNRSMIEAIKEAKKFVVVEGFDLGRDDFVDLLIDKAKAGVNVVCLFDPVNEPREKKKGELLDRMRQAKLPNLKVAEYDLVKNHTKNGFDQILHVKKVITDTPDGGIAEHSGGINFNPNSIFNLDFGWRTDGLAVIDSLRHVVQHWKTSAGDWPFDLGLVPPAAQIEKVAAARAKKTKAEAVEVEMASAGKMPVPEPRKYTKKKLLERAQLGKKLIVSAQEALKPEVRANLEMAVHNGSLVQVVHDQAALSEEDGAAFEKLKKPLKDAGIAVFKSDDFILEDSYFELVSRELDVAKDKKESVEIAAFALSHPDILDRLVACHEAGCDVKVLVDDLNIFGNLINQKAMALLSEKGVPVRGVDALTKERIAEAAGTKPHLLKLHAKYLCIGGNRVLGGSANFSSNGMGNNVEDGRLVRSKTVAKAVSKTLFEPLWKQSREIEALPTVPDAKRVPLLGRPKMNTKIEDLVFLVMDLETTGFVARYDDRIIQIAAQAIKVDPKTGETEVLGEFDQLLDPGTNQMGQKHSVPAPVRKVVGEVADRLDEEGRSVREVLPAFAEFAKSLEEHGEVVLAGQNLPFDLRFLDHTMSRKELTVELDGEPVHLTLDGPYVDAIDPSTKLFPEEKSHNLDAHMERFGIEHRDDLPRHDAFADVVYTGEALAKLIVHGGFTELSDLVAPDRVQLSQAAPMSKTPRKTAGTTHVLDFNDSGKLVLQVQDHLTKAAGPSRRVYDLQVLDRKNKKLQVAATVGRGERTETVEGWIDEKLVDGFRTGGKVYHQMRQDGLELAKPQVLTY